MTIQRTPAVALAGLLGLLVAADFFGAELNRLFLALPGIDKILHVGFHVALFPCVRALAKTLVGESKRTLVAVGVGLAIAVTDELAQGLTTTRTPDFADLIANGAGLALGWIVTMRPRRAVALSVAAVSISAAGYVTYTTYVHLRDYSRGLQYERQHDFVRAREYYLRALASGLRTPALLNGLSWVEIESGHGDARKAVEWAEAALAAQPGNADMLDTYGWALHHAGRSADALQPLSEAYARKPDMYCIHYHLAAVYRALGRPEEARAHFLEQLKLPRTREARLARSALAEMNSP